MEFAENPMIAEIEALKLGFLKTIDKLTKDIHRHDKIMARSDKRQQQEYDELQRKFEEVAALQREIEDTQKEVVFTMGAIGESRSKETGNHVKRVAEYSKLFAIYYGLDEAESEMLKQASPMHDIGKVAIADSILNKPAKFTEDEFVIMQRILAVVLRSVLTFHSQAQRVFATVAYEHHEKYNGKGYPKGIKGEDIHIHGRITAIADVFDALGSDRCYKKAWEDEKIFELFRSERGEHFDPRLVDIFFDHMDEFLSIRNSMKDV